MLRIEEPRVSALEGAGLLAGYYYDPYPPRFAANLKEILAGGARVLVRLHAGVRYPMSDAELRDGLDQEAHVVAVVGYDDDSNEFILADPWDRDAFGGDDGGLRRVPETELGLRFVNSTFDKAITVFPLSVHVGGTPVAENVTELEARVALRGPAPQIRSGATALEDLTASIRLPDGLELLSDRRCSSPLLANAAEVSFRWSVRELAPVDGDVSIAVAATAHGEDPYRFQDVVGAEAATRVRSVVADAEHAIEEVQAR